MREIIETNAAAWAVASVSAEEIDRINILQASILAMHRALDMLAPRPGAVIVDGNRFTPYGTLPCTTFVKGDGRFANIAAASILAKTHRDQEMKRLHALHPQVWLGCKQRISDKSPQSSNCGIRSVAIPPNVIPAARHTADPILTHTRLVHKHISAAPMACGVALSPNRNLFIIAQGWESRVGLQLP